MMEFGLGLIEIFMILVMGGTLPADNAPLPAADVMAGMPAECEVMGFMDLRAAGDRFDAFLTDVGTQPWIAGDADTLAGFEELRTMLSEARTTATAELGFDPTNSISTVSFCARLAPQEGGMPLPDFLVIARGDFPDSVAGMLAPLFDFGSLTLTNGSPAFGFREDSFGIAMASPTPGLLVVGSEAWVTSRVGGVLGTEYLAADPSSLVGRVAAVAEAGVTGFIGFEPGTLLTSLLAAEAPTSFAEILSGTGHLLSAWDGASSYLEARAINAETFADFEYIVGGMASYSRAFNLAMRGAVRIGLGILTPDEAEMPSVLRNLATHRDVFLTYVEGMGFGAEPVVTYNADAATQTISLTVDMAGGQQAAATVMMLGVMVGYATFARADHAPSMQIEAPRGEVIEAHPPH